MHSARRLTAPPFPLPRAPSLPTLLVPSVFAVGARRSSGEGGDSQRSTRTITSALAARLVVHLCTRGSKCRAHGAHADAVIGSAKRARARTAVPHTARGDRRVACKRTYHNCAFRPTQPTFKFGAAGRAATFGDERGAPPSPCTSVCQVVPVLEMPLLATQYVDIGRSTHRMDARIGPFPLKSDFSQCAASAAELSGESIVGAAYA